MKHIVALLSLLLTIGTTFANKHPFVNLSPVPNSKYNKPQATIIIRPGYDITAHLINQLRNTTVVGSQSGRTTFDVRTSSDNKVVVLKLHKDMAPGESVRVTFDPTIQGANLQPIGNFDYTYQISDYLLRKAQEERLNPPKPPREEEIQQPVSTSRNPDTLPSNFTHLSLHKYGVVDTGILFIGLPVYGPYELIALTSEGEPFFLANNNDDANDFRPLNDSTLVFSYARRPNIGVSPGYKLMDCNKQITYNIKMLDGYEWQCSIHEILMTPNGTIVTIAEDTQYVDMSQLVPNGAPNRKVLGNTIQEIDYKNNLVVSQWQTWDHFNLLDATGVDWTDTNNTTPANSAHINALAFDLDWNILVSSYSRNEIVKVSYLTGDILWYLGGKLNQFTFVNDPDNGTSRQHNITRLPNGHLTVFDNGLTHSVQKTRLKEYALNIPNKIATLVWSVPSPNTPTLATGSMQRLPNGNTLACWGAMSATNNPVLVSEFAPDSTLVYEVKTTSAPPFKNLAYRAYKFPWKWCEVSSVLNQAFGEGINLQAQPNPASDKVRIAIESEIQKGASIITVISYDGKMMFQQKFDLQQKQHYLDLNTTDWASGMYFYQVNIGNGAKTGRFNITH